MSRLFTLILAVCVPMMIAACAAKSGGEPSEGARGMPGAMGTFEYRPDDWKEGETTWWKDTDGVAPGAPGCHFATDSKGTPNGRMFPEACLDDKLLVESNPGAGVLHSHTKDIGNPDKFDCNAWCIGMGASKGSCAVAAAPSPCAESKPAAQSAMCVCL